MEFLRGRLFFVIPFIALMGFMPISAAIAASITLAWDPNPPEDEVAGYVVYYGKTPGRYTGTVDVGNLTTCTLAGLTPGVPYYIALTAYDASDTESDLSAEVSGIGTPVPPGITSLQINDGASSTGTKTVLLNNAATNKPTHYMASESPSFEGARWTFYSVKPRFTLTSGAGTKTVYFKLKSKEGESSVASDTIALVAPAVTSFQINSGASSTTSKTVTLNNTTTIKPTHYMASESPSFVGARWTFYSVQPRFTLSEGAGTKTVYFKVKNSVGESVVVSDSITLE
jgi:cytochrome c oxidase assembly protein Cox11